MSYDVWLNCAATDADSNIPRNFAWGIHRDGFGPIVDRLVKVSEGRRVMLHNPFGRTPGRVMEFDQQLNCEHAGLAHVIKSFVCEVPRLTAIAREVVIYLGSPHNTPRMNNVLQQPNGLDNWWWNWWRALQLPLELGCSIALDNASAVPSEWQAAAMVALRGMLCDAGRELYIEATPEFGSLLYNRAPMIARDVPAIRNRHMQPQHPGAVGRFPIARQRGWYQHEVIALIPNSAYGASASGALVQRMDDLAVLGISSMIGLGLAERLLSAGFGETG